jgi:hypothetical protein
MGGREVIVIRDEKVFLQWSGRVLDKVQHGICIIQSILYHNIIID